MRPAAACRPARPTPPSRRERFQCASRWVLKPTFQKQAISPPWFTHPSYSSFSFSAHASANPFGSLRDTQVFSSNRLQLLKTWAIWLWHFKTVSNRWGLGSLIHSPWRSHSRTHARTHAALSFLTALGQWLAPLSVTEPALSAAPPPAPRRISL